MAGFEEQLNNILGNQEAMNQIMALARSLSGDQPPAEQETPALEGSQDKDQTVEAPLPELSALLGQVDPNMLQAGMEVLRQVQSTEDRNTALINALRPFLREERRARLDRALQIVRITKVIRVVLGTLGGKEGERV